MSGGDAVVCVRSNLMTGSSWIGSLKLLLPPISKDVASERPQSKEEAILKAQQFDLIYAQSGYLYTIILDAPHAGTSY